MLPSTRDEAIEFLMRSINYERCDPGVGTDASFKLQTMHWLAKRFGDPHRDYPVIHVAGTKGKGSTATMIAEMLSHAGIRTGLYTSPHLHRLEERLAIDGAMISETQLLEVVQDLARVVDSLQGEIDGGQFTGKMPTFFELVTMAALLFFSRRQVDAAVVEVGLGGRLDSTNVCHADVGVITSISKDHIQQLGHTLDAIAGEKAGIIKPGMRVVSGVLQSEAAEVIRQRAEEVGAELYILGRDFIIEPEKTVAANAVTSEGQASETVAAVTQDARYHFRWQIPPAESKKALTSVSNLKIALRGAHQMRNAGLAIAATQLCRELEFSVPARSIQAGIGTARLPGRIEFLRGAMPIVVDVAHNPAAILALVGSLEEERKACRRTVVICSISVDKDAREILSPLLSFADTLILTAFQDNPRAFSPRALYEIASEAMGQAGHEGMAQLKVLPDPDAVMAWFTSAADARDFALVTGSTFLVSELRHPLQKWNQRQLPALGQAATLPSS